MSHCSTDYWNYFSGYRFTQGRNSVLDYWDFEIAIIHSRSNQEQKDKQARRNPLHDKASEKRRTAHPIRRAYHAHCSREHFARHKSSVLCIKTVIFDPRYHVIPWYWWACFLVFLLQISFLFNFLFIRSRIESNSHCRSSKRRVWLSDGISITDYQIHHRSQNHETDSTTIFDQVNYYQERASLSVSEQIPHHKFRSSSRKSAASTDPDRYLVPIQSTFDNESEIIFLQSSVIFSFW